MDIFFPKDLKYSCCRRKRLTRSQLTALGRRINFAKSVLYMASALQDGPMAGKVSFPTIGFRWVSSSGFRKTKVTHKKAPAVVVAILAAAPL
jgi:hypothetical protein